MKIAIIIPTYNEKANIAKMIPILEDKIFPQIKNHEMQILVVDDKSPDGTADEVKKAMGRWKNINLLSGEKNGLGAAYVRGMHYAMDEIKADAVMEFDSDFQHDPQDIPKLIKALDEGADYVIGSRYVSGGAIPKEWGIDRKFLSFFGSLLTRIVWFNFSIHDMTAGFKLTKTSYLKRVDLDHLLSRNFAYKLHIMHDVIKLGAKVKEVPIIFYEREEGVSKINKKDQIDSLYVIFMLRILEFKRFIKFLFVGGTGFIVQYAVTYFCIQLGLEQYISVMIAAETAILCNFTLNNFWTFGDTKKIKEQGNFFRRLVKFNTASLAAIGIQTLAAYIAVAVFGETIIIYGREIHTSLVILFPTIILLVLPLNYFVYNHIIWKTQYLKKKKE